MRRRTRSCRSPRGRQPRSAFVTIIAIMASGVLLLIVAVLARFATSELTSERTAALSTRAEQILLSARDWSRAHIDELNQELDLELPLDDLLPPLATGRLELHYRESNDCPSLIECHVTIHQGRAAVTRHVCWPAATALSLPPE